MKITSNKNIKIFLNKVLGPLLFIWLSYSIYQQIISQADLNESIRYITEAVSGVQAWQFWLAILLMVFNWIIEARKWKVLMSPLQQISMWHSFKGVLAGLAFALSTPNRVGEYGGRMLYIEEGKRRKSVSITVIGSLSQLIITLLAGSIGLVLVKKDLVQSISSYDTMPVLANGLQWIAITAGIVLTVFYFRLDWLMKCCELIRLREKWLQYIRVSCELDVTILLRVLGLSAFRYAVFVYQYILLLQVMHVNLKVNDAFWIISILYLILALVPTIALLELGLRGKLAILLFQFFSNNILGIYAASTGIWLINLVLPAIAGSLLVAGIKFFNVRQNEDKISYFTLTDSSYASSECRQ
ncbi:MAG: lysylphosphatidylglycerol synthase domain-containing protein [Agriterribacter sp.]